MGSGSDHRADAGTRLVSLAGLRSLVRPFFVLFALYLVASLPLLRANYNYMDDMARAYEGFAGWGSGASRYLSDILAFALHTDTYLADISPIPQIIALAIMALTSVLVARLLRRSGGIRYTTLVASVPLAFSPYFLQCLSYKYDAPYMALSVLFSVLPFAFVDGKRSLKLTLAAVCTLGMCATYQAASGIFPMLAILVCAKSWHDGGDTRKAILEMGQMLLAYGIALLAYRVFLTQPEFQVGAISVATPSLSELPATFFGNLLDYYGQVLSDARALWLVIASMCFLVLLVGFVATSKRSKKMAPVVLFATVAAMALVCFGAYPLLAEPSFAPRAMIGFGAFLAFLCMLGCEVTNWTALRAVFIVFSFVLLSFAMMWGNVLADQREWTQFRVEGVAEALNDAGMLSGDEERIVQIEGGIGVSPVVRNMPDDYRMLRRMLHPTFDGSYYWGRYLLLNYYGIANLKEDPSVDLASMDLSVLTETYYYTIRGNDQYVLILLNP